MPVTRHPLHRSGREARPHPAPTLGMTASGLVHRAWPNDGRAVHASAPGTRAPGSASGTGDGPHVPLGHRPALHPLRGPSWRLVRRLLRYDLVSNETGCLPLRVTLSTAFPRGVVLAHKGRWPKRAVTQANVNTLNPGEKSDMGENTCVHGVEIVLTPLTQA